MFIIFINDLPDDVTCTCKIFADDAKIYNSHDNNILIQNDLLNVFKWSEKWLLKFNKSKCSVLHMGTKNKRNIYYMDSDSTIPLKSIDSEKDVGVTFSTDLKF